jgi:AraC-like DNA-binding protein
VKKAKKSIPVIDLWMINRKKLHEDVVAEPLADLLRIFDKLHGPHRHTFYQVILITQGSGSQTIDFEQFEIKPGMICFMIPGQVHSWNIKDKVDGYVISFSENVYSSLISNPFYLDQFSFLRGISKDSAIDLKKESLKESVYFIKQIMNEIKKKDTFTLDKVSFHLLSLFINITRHHALSVKKQIPEQKQNILFNFRALVNQYYITKRLPKDYAPILYVTANYLNALCKDLLGRSAGQVIRDKILLEAKRLMVNVDLSISEIAYKLNFTDNSYFTKFFKKYTGLTPQEFRKYSIEITQAG